MGEWVVIHIESLIYHLCLGKRVFFGEISDSSVFKIWWGFIHNSDIFE